MSNHYHFLIIIILLFTALLPLHVTAQENLIPIALENVNQIKELMRWDDESYAVAFSPDNTKLVFSSGAGDAVLVDIVTGNRIRTLSGHTDTITGLSFSPDGTRLLTTSAQDKTIRLWDVESGDQIMIVEQYQTNARKAVFSPDGATLVSADSDSVYLYDANTGEQIERISVSEINDIVGLEYKGDEIVGVLFSTDGTNIIVDAGIVVAMLNRLNAGASHGFIESYSPQSPARRFWS